MRIVFLGDSLTWGGYGGDFVAWVGELLPEYEIINAGVGGDTVVNLLWRLDSVLEAHAPDAVFVMVGGNDATSYAMPKTRGYYRKAKQLEEGLVAPEEFEATYRELLLQLQVNLVQAFVGLAPTEYSAELVKTKQAYNAQARQVAESLNIPVLDLDTPYTPENPIERPEVDIAFIQRIGNRASSGWNDYESERAKWGYTYTFDGMHILPATAESFAQRIVAFLREELG